MKLEAAHADLMSRYTVEQIMILLEFEMYERFQAGKADNSIQGMQKCIGLASVCDKIKDALETFRELTRE